MFSTALRAVLRALPTYLAVMLIVALYVVVSFDGAAYAQVAATTTTTTISLTPLFTQLMNDYLLPVLGTLVAAVVGWLAMLATKRLGVSISDAMRQQVVDFAEMQAKAILAKVVNTKDFNIDVKNPLIAAAAREAELHVADALRAIGISPAAVIDYVGKLIVAHLGAMTATEPDHPTPAGAIAGTNVAPDGATVAAAPASAA
jgi:hypothetical protein